jgi:hypothetical protein
MKVFRACKKIIRFSAKINEINGMFQNLNDKQQKLLIKVLAKKENKIKCLNPITSKHCE